MFNTIYADELDLNDEELYLKRLNETFCEISDNNSLYVMEPIPEIGFDVPSRLSRKIFLNYECHLDGIIEFNGSG